MARASIYHTYRSKCVFKFECFNKIKNSAGIPQDINNNKNIYIIV